MSCRGGEREVIDFAGGLTEPVVVLADPDGRDAANWGVSMAPFALVVDSTGTVQGKRARAALRDLEIPLKTVRARPIQMEDRIV